MCLVFFYVESSWPVIRSSFQIIQYSLWSWQSYYDSINTQKCKLEVLYMGILIFTACFYFFIVSRYEFFRRWSGLGIFIGFRWAKVRGPGGGNPKRIFQKKNNSVYCYPFFTLFPRKRYHYINLLLSAENNWPL